MQKIVPSELPARLFATEVGGQLDRYAFRLADRSDLKPLYSGLYSHLQYSEFRDRYDHFLNAQLAGRSYWLVAEDCSQLVGSGQLIAYPSSAELANLTVVQERQGKGIGTAMISVLTAIAGHIGLDSLEIGVDASNSRALALYQRLGFETDRQLRLPVGQPALVLRKLL